MNVALSPPAVALVGAGRAGGTLGVLLAAAGWPVSAVWSRRGARARKVCRWIAARSRFSPRSTTVLRTAARDADCVILAVPDDALAATATELAAGKGHRPAVTLHLSGARGVEVLAPLRRSGVHVGCCHPLAVLPASPPPAGLLRDSLFAWDGDAAAGAVARRLALDLGGRAVRLRPGDRAAYHLAAALVANDTVALFAMALDLLRGSGLDEQTARRGLARLLAGTAGALLQKTPEKALTGPVARGDAETLRRHLAVAPARTARIHRQLASELLRLVRRRGSLTPSAEKALERLLS